MMINILKISTSFVIIFVFNLLPEYVEAYYSDVQSPESYLVSNDHVKIPEVYELANVILALTQYGLDDLSEVNKNSDYYRNVISFFKPVADHPIVKSANYSRNEWRKYLCFRTDAFAFSFNSNGQIVRNSNFYSMWPLNEFENQLPLIQDFVLKSNFRAYYKQNQRFYESIVNSYNEYNMVSNIQHYLDYLFKNVISDARKVKFEIILSPLVGRMNCLRNVNDTIKASFVPVPEMLLSDSIHWHLPQQLIDMHAVFTELDHGYVNPFTAGIKKEISKSFKYKKWDTGSGYKKIDCYNEYLTWALYDLFIWEHYPHFRDSVCLQWHYQAASRGFYASKIFSDHLLELYIKYRGTSDNLSTIISNHLRWCDSIQGKISLPVIINSSKTIEILGDTLNCLLRFKHPMKETNVISYILLKCTDSDNDIIYRHVHNISSINSNLTWRNPNTLQLKVVLADPTVDKVRIIFNWWGCKYPISDMNGVLLRPGSEISTYINRD